MALPPTQQLLENESIHSEWPPSTSTQQLLENESIHSAWPPSTSTQQLLENESIHSEWPPSTSIDISHSCCVAFLCRYLVEGKHFFDLYHISVLQPPIADAMWNTAAARNCQVWLIGGNIIPGWRPGRDFHQDRPIGEYDDWRTFAQGYEEVVGADKHGGGVECAFGKLDRILEDLRMKGSNSVLPTLLCALVRNREARVAMAEGKLELMNSTHTINIRNREATLPKVILGGADRLATILHTDGTLQVSFGQLRESNRESIEFSKALIDFLTERHSKWDNASPFPSLAATPYQLGVLCMNASRETFLLPRHSPPRHYPRTLNPWRQYMVGRQGNEIRDDYDVLGTAMHQWQSIDMHHVEIPLVR